MTIKVTSTTMGQQSRASLGNGKPYRWHGLEPGQETPEPAPRGCNAKASARRQERIAEYARLRLGGASKEEAGRQVGLRSLSAVADYEREFQEQQPDLLGPALSEPCEQGECEGCFPDEPGGCGHGCHDEEVRYDG